MALKEIALAAQLAFAPLSSGVNSEPFDQYREVLAIGYNQCAVMVAETPPAAIEVCVFPWTDILGAKFGHRITFRGSPGDTPIDYPIKAGNTKVFISNIYSPNSDGTIPYIRASWLGTGSGVSFAVPIKGQDWKSQCENCNFSTAMIRKDVLKGLQVKQVTKEQSLMSRRLI